MEYCGIDLHAEYSQICILDENCEVMETSKVRTSRKALERFFHRDRMRVVMEAGGSSTWVSRLLNSLGQEVVVGTHHAPVEIFIDHQSADRSETGRSSIAIHHRQERSHLRELSRP